jgi:hypothetical protein
MAALCAGGVAAAEKGTLPDYRLLLLDGQPVKWGTPVLGTPAIVTYAIADRDFHFPKARNCEGIGPIDSILSANQISRGAFESELGAALAAWESVAGVSFLRTDSTSANILIGAETAPLGRAFSNVADDDTAAGRGVRPINQAMICLNPEKAWKVGFDGNLNSFDLRYTFTHEIGHTIGLDHPSVSGQLMDFRYDERFRTPQLGDIRGVTALYGPKVMQEVAVGSPTSPAGMLARAALSSAERGLSAR